MPIDKASSDRLSVLRFPLIVGVVFIHAYDTEVGFSNGAIGVEETGYIVNFMRDFFSQGIARIAVPLFFLMSGYFLFLDSSFSSASYGKKLRSRIDTLLVPFLFWNIFTLLLLSLAQAIPTTQSFFSGKNAAIASYGVFDYFNAIFGFNRYPISYQFWFIRDLMVMVLLSPAIYLFIKSAGIFFLFILLTLWFLGIWPVYIPSAAAFVFFYSGAFFALTKTSLFTLDRFGPFILGFYLSALLLDTLTKGCIFNQYIHKTGIIAGLACALYVTRVIVDTVKLKKLLLWASGCSLFVFAVHEPLLTVARKVSYKIINPSHDITILSLYFLVPVFVIAFAILSYITLRSLTPKFLSVISGGR